MVTWWICSLLTDALSLWKEATSLHGRPDRPQSLFESGDSENISAHIRNQFPIVCYVAELFCY
jgi:hypothetical protein